MNEGLRLSELDSYGVMDTNPEERFDRLTRLSADMLQAPIALISLVDQDRQWFKSCLGLDQTSTPRMWAFCDHVIHESAGNVLVVQDATQDTRFNRNPLVTHAPHIRFYVGTPLVNANGHVLGTLCVIDTVSRPTPSDSQMNYLREFAAIAVDELELTRRTRLAHERGSMLDLAGQMSGVGYWWVNYPSRRLTWSDQVYAITGASPAEFDPNVEDALAFYQDADRAFIAKLMELAEISCQGFEFKARITRRDGQLRDVASKGQCQTGEQGQITAMIGVYQDITDQVRATQALQETAATFQLLAESSGDMVSLVNRDGRRRYVSPASRHIFGLEPADLMNRNVLNLIHPSDVPAVAGLQIGLLTGAVPLGLVTFRVQRAGSEELWVESSSRALKSPQTGEPDGYVSVCRDITKRQQLLQLLLTREKDLSRANASLEKLARHLTRARDQAELSNTAKSRFLTAISHELRTPLNGILGYAQLLQIEGGLNDGQTLRVRSMLDAGAYLLSMINDVLHIAEIETQHVELRPMSTDLVALARTCLDVLRPASQKSGLTLVFSPPSDNPCWQVVDPIRLRQVLLNLLGNAVKYTAGGTVTLRMSFPLETLVRFEVADTGPGIPLEKQEALFREFERLGRSSDNLIEGAGLGLSISARLVAMMDGRIGYSDNTPRGSVFWFDIPITGNNATSLGIVIDKGAETPRLSGVRVLVVDDLTMNRDIAVGFLEAAGCHVGAAEGGEEAITMAGEQDFDVVLMDVRMPDIDGFEATRRIRNLPGSRGSVPIIALTAQSFVEQITLCEEAGMTAHLAKPYSQQALAQAVFEAVNTPRSPNINTLVHDRAVFDRTASYLSSDAIDGYIHTLITRSQGLRASLLARPSGSFAEDAHSLAGSAGMFGFTGLATAARAYENGCLDPKAAANFETELVTALEKAIEAMASLLDSKKLPAA